MPYTEFHYTPTGTGVISGKEVLEQTEDAINDLGGQISGDVQTAIDTANNALNTANTASADAQNAVNTANTAYTAATNAQNTANTAQNTASNALTAAQNAQNDVNALGNRVTTAENNISQNTSDISGLTTRMGTAEGNITTLQNDVITAQGTATSAQNTATLARGQAYVVRYASVAVSDNSTVPYTDLNNTDNVKANDLLLDINGKIYQISAVDTSNETVSVTTPLTQLAVDSSVVHNIGNETVGGIKTFSDDIVVKKIVSSVSQLQINAKTNADAVAIIAGASATDGGGIWIYGKNSSNKSLIGLQVYDADTSTFHAARLNMDGSFTPTVSNNGLGSQSFKWVGLNGINPGALSLPDLNNGIDISGYFTIGTSSNSYTPIVDGWICIKGVASGNSGIYVESTKGFYCSASNLVDINSTDRIVLLAFPVIKNEQYTIVLKTVNTSIVAKFFPCLGNV